MPFAISPVYTSIKSTVGGLGAVTSVGVLIAGVVVGGGAGVVMIIGGVIFCCQSGMLLVDGTAGAQKIRKYVHDLHISLGEMSNELGKLAVHNTELSTNVTRIDAIKKQLLAEVSRLKLLGDAGADRIDELTRIKSELEESVSDGKSTILELSQLKNDYMLENAILRDTITDTKSSLAHIEKLKAEYEAENDILLKHIHVLGTTNIELTDTKTRLIGEVDKLRTLHRESKALIRNLVAVGDTFNQFNNEFANSASMLDDTRDDLQETADALTKITVRLEQEVSKLSDKK